MPTTKDEYKAALKLLYDEAQFEDWTKSVNAFHLLNSLIDIYCDETKKNKDAFNLKHLRINFRMELSYYGQQIEVDVYDIDSGKVVKQFKSKKKQGFDNMLFEEVFSWLEDKYNELSDA